MLKICRITLTDFLKIGVCILVYVVIYGGCEMPVILCKIQKFVFTVMKDKPRIWREM